MKKLFSNPKESIEPLVRQQRHYREAAGALKRDIDASAKPASADGQYEQLKDWLRRHAEIVEAGGYSLAAFPEVAATKTIMLEN